MTTTSEKIICSLHAAINQDHWVDEDTTGSVEAAQIAIKNAIDLIKEQDDTIDAVRIAVASARDTGGEYAITADVFELLVSQLGVDMPEGESE